MSSEAVVTIEFDPRSLESVLEDKGVTQADLARILGYSHRNTVNKIIKGKRELTATELLRISAALGLAPETFAKAA